MMEEPGKDIFISRFFTAQRKKILLLSLVIVTSLFFVCNDVIMPWFVQRGNTVQVPSVIGSQYEAAKHFLDSLDLTAIEGDSRTSEMYPAGTVIAQNPNPGTIVKRGRRVYLVVSGGEQLVQVPSLKGKTVRDAKFALERNGLTIGVISYMLNDSFPANTIIDQSLPPASKIRRGARIAVVVSQGASSNRVTVPEVIGKPLREAGRILANHGLKLGAVNYQVSSTLLPNTVLDQYPRPGEFIEHGQKVDLFVSRSGDVEKPPTEN